MKPKELRQFVFVPFRIDEVLHLGSNIPRPRSGHRIICDDSHIYCYGGYNPSLPFVHIRRSSATWTPEKPLFKELWSFSIAKRIWKLHTIENMPEELASNAMSINGRYLMIFGGTGAPFGDKCSNDVLTWRTDSIESRLRTLEANGIRPPGQYGPAVLCLDNSFYTIGGTNGYAYNCDIYRLDLCSLLWEPIFVGSGQEDEPLGRYRHEVACIGNKLYIIGGGTADMAYELMDVPVFDLEKRTWEHLKTKIDGSLKTPSGPLPRKCHSAVQIDSPSGAQVFVAGGSDGLSILDDVWKLDFSTLQWTLMRKTVLPSPLYFHSSTVTAQGCMYIFGGIEPQSDAACRNNKLYKVWLRVPKLSEMCWEAMLYYNPNLGQKGRHCLLDNGIPLHFVDRLVNK